ncbi:MAG: SDR family oxidoreductase [Planctomycetes bacterium]|nr:SDR family oxidoreductase [Planctomycetota bacterium]
MSHSMELLFTGANGFLGRHVAAVVAEEGVRAVPWLRRGDAAGAERAPLEDAAAVRRALERRRPSAVLHLAARADVGACLADPEGALAVNAELPARLAAACAELGVRFVHLSTDMVFDGTRAPYAESDLPRPLSTYGRSKRAGEEAVLAAHPAALVVRLPLLFGDGLGLARGATEGLRRALANGGTAKLFRDERRSALHARDAARALITLSRATCSGLLHVAARDALSRHELGLALAARAGLESGRIEAIAQAQVPSAEPRPSDLELDVRRALALGLALPSVREGVERDGARPR